MLRSSYFRSIEHDRALKFKNSKGGFETILARIREICKKEKFAKVVVGMEPTGHYWKAFANWLEKQEGIKADLVNPYTTKQAKELDDFYTTIQDDCIRKNPFDFQLNTVIEDDTEPKVPLTAEQEGSLLSFMQSDSVYQKYRDEVIILLGTELRISELCGLTETDLDFENKIINVGHQLLTSAETGYYIEKPKTQSSIRQIPMIEKVYEALGRVLENRKGTKQITIDDYNNFLFLNWDGYPKTNVNYAIMFRGLRRSTTSTMRKPYPK